MAIGNPLKADVAVQRRISQYGDRNGLESSAVLREMGMLPSENNTASLTKILSFFYTHLFLLDLINVRPGF